MKSINFHGYRYGAVHIHIPLLVLLLIVNIAQVFGQSDGLPRGAHQMPYTRYEANAAALGGGATLLAQTFDQKKTESEATDQVCASLSAQNSFVRWNLSQAGQGLVLRFSMPDAAGGGGQSGSLALYVGGNFVQNISLSSKWAWQYFSPNPGDGTKDPVNGPSAGWTARMRFDEVRVKLPSSATVGTEVRLQKTNGDAITYLVDFIEMEPIPQAIGAPANSLSVTAYGAVANDANDDMQAFVNCMNDAKTQGKSLYIPAGRFLLGSQGGKWTLQGVSNMTIQGAGIWHTELYFTNPGPNSGGIEASGSGIHLRDFYMNTENTSRTSGYKGITGGYGTSSSVERVWAEHFEVGAWIANWQGSAITDGMLITGCRFRNNYADGVNFSKGTSNSICEHTSFRNNGDDAMATWSSFDGTACVNNEFRYCTAENTWRAAGIGFFGGGGHKGHHLLIKDCVETGIRVNSDFPGPEFSTTLWMEIYETTVTNSGTNANLWYNRYGAVDIFTRLYNLQNLRLRNVDILNSQKDAIMIYTVNPSFRITNLELINVTVDGAGKDNNVNNYTSGTYDDYAGHGLLVLPNVSGSMTTQNLIIRNAPTAAINNESSATFPINTIGTQPVTGVNLTPATASLAEGATLQLIGTVEPANATNRIITYSTSNAAVATVDATGKVTATGVGTATITATTDFKQANGQPFTDTSVITVTPAVTITATDASAGEGGNVGVFRIGTSSTASNITVNYTVSGTASAADYSPALSGSVTLTPANPAVNITITPVDDTAFEGNETLTLTLQPGAGFTLGGSTSATITIADNDSAPCTAPVVGFTTSPPAIDQGIDAAWNNVPAGVINNVTFGARPSDFTGSQWRALYTSTMLYVLVEVKDNNRFNDSGTSWWEDDVVEIFIDGDNSKGATYDGVNDFQLGFRYNDPSSVKVGQNSVNRTTGIAYAIQNVTGGYNVEVAIPWSTIGVTPVSGNRIGLEIAVDDDDNGGARDAQMSAFATNANAFSSPAVFGSVVLTTSCGNTGVQTPVVSNVSLPTATVNTAYTAAITATNSPASFGATGLPAGLSVNTTTGAITGTPTATGSFTVTLSATNSAGTGTKQLTLQVNANTVPVVSNTLLANGTVGTAYNATITATNSPTGFGATGLPAGLSVNTTTGVISGTPTAAGTFTVTLSATNGSGTGTKQLSLLVNANNVPVVSNTSLANGTVGSAYNATITATNSPTGFGATGLPAGLSVNTTTGVISGTPTASGTFTVTLSATNGSGTGTKQLSLLVNPGSVTQAPFGGTARSIPGTIQAEDFDTGGEGIAYHDLDVANAGGQYRTTDGVDIEACSEGGFNVGWLKNTEWLEYTVNVTAGTYTLQVRVSTNLSGRTLHAELDGVNISGAIAVPNTGGWQSWQTVSVTTTALTAGQKVLRLVFDSDDMNLNYVSFTTGGGTATTYRIKNRWQNTYLYDAGDRVRYSATPSGTTYQWTLEDVGSGLRELKNVSTGEYMHIENLLGYVQCTTRTAGWGSARWTVEDAGSGFVRFKNAWQSNQYIHVENLQNQAQYGTISTDWMSAQWVLEPVSGARMAAPVVEAPEEGIDVTYWPNEVTDELTIRTDGKYEEVQIVDMLGRVSVRESVWNRKSVVLDVRALSGGVHIVNLRSKTRSYTFRVVKR